MMGCGCQDNRPHQLNSSKLYQTLNYLVFSIELYTGLWLVYKIDGVVYTHAERPLSICIDLAGSKIAITSSICTCLYTAVKLGFMSMRLYSTPVTGQYRHTIINYTDSIVIVQLHCTFDIKINVNGINGH